jgi:hypothetical protein
VETENATRVLTGTLPFIVLLSAAIAYPLSRFLLNLYRSAVVRMMALRRGGAPIAPGVQPLAGAPPLLGALPGSPGAPQAESAPPSPGSSPLEHATARQRAERSPRPLAIRTVQPGGQRDPHGRQLYERAIGRAWRSAATYAAGGAVYAVIMASALLIADGSFSPLRFIALFFVYVWPVLLSVNIVVAARQRTKGLMFGTYFACLVLVSIGIAAVSPSVSVLEMFVPWLVYALPPTVLLIAFLSRHVRAVGPMVLAFVMIAFTGANAALAIAGSSDAVLGDIAAIAVALGSNAIGALVAIVVVGLLVFAIFGWLANGWIRRLYLAKRISDQSMALDSMWLLFAITQSVYLAFFGPAWFMAGLLAFAVYKVVVVSGMSLTAGSDAVSSGPVRLLFLRVFSLGRRSEQTFDYVSSYWRHIGNVQMIAGPDLATTTIEPHEFLEYLSGRLSRAFVGDADAFDARTRSLDEAQDLDGRFRVNDFFCYDDTWRMVVSRLAARSDAVFLDARGFSASNAGVAYELSELVNAVPLNRVVLAYDRTTDAQYLHRTIDRLWSDMAASSPNRSVAEPFLTLCNLPQERSADVAHVLDRLCAAAAMGRAPGR